MRRHDTAEPLGPFLDLVVSGVSSRVFDEHARSRLAVLLHGVLGGLPGATSIGLHASERWAFVLITAASDEAVSALGEALGLA